MGTGPAPSTRPGTSRWPSCAPRTSAAPSRATRCRSPYKLPTLPSRGSGLRPRASASSAIRSTRACAGRRSAWTPTATRCRCTTATRRRRKALPRRERAEWQPAGGHGLVSALSEPATWALLEYRVPAAWLPSTRPARSTSQTPITSTRWRAENTAMRCNRDDKGNLRGDWLGAGPPLARWRDGADVDELEPERLDALEHAEEGGLIDDLAVEHGPGRRRPRRQAVERGDQRGAEPAADRDLVVGGLHGATACAPPV